MTDKDVEQEIEANEERASDGDRDTGGIGLGQSINNAVGSLLSPAGSDHLDEDEEQERRTLNDAEQRPE